MKRAMVALLALLLAVLAATSAVLVVRPPFARPLLQLVEARIGGDAQSGDAQNATGAPGQFEGIGDAVPTGEESAAEEAEWLERHRTPLVAQVGDVYLRSPIAPADLTGVLFHQASYDYALIMTTELPEANYEWVEAHRIIPHNVDQQEGEWLDAEALHLWRTSDTTAMDTSIDIGALPGTVARSPISGTVVLLKDYLLYDEVPDIEIHIQPDGAPDMDCVLIHTTDPLVSAGDHVEAGITELCHVRDIEKDLTDVQLSFFTPEGVGGNHIHVQVNDATTKGYRKNKLKGAVTP